MEKKKSRILRKIKKLFLILNTCLHFSQPINIEARISDLKQKTREKKKHLITEDFRERNDNKKEKIIKTSSKVEKKIIQNKAKNLFSYKRSLFSTHEILNHMCAHAFMIFYDLFFLSAVFFVFCVVPLRPTGLSKWILIACLFFFILVSFFEASYFYSRCNLLLQSDSPWTALYFISFLIFITANYFLNSVLFFKKFSHADKPIEKFIVFRPWAGYKQTRINEIRANNFGFFSLLSKTIIFENKNFVYNTQALIVSTVFFTGLIAEAHFFLKEKKINQLWIPLSDLLFFFVICYSAFGYKGTSLTI